MTSGEGDLAYIENERRMSELGDESPDCGRISQISIRQGSQKNMTQMSMKDRKSGAFEDISRSSSTFRGGKTLQVYSLASTTIELPEASTH